MIERAKTQFFELLDLTQKYLSQQRDLCGDEVFIQMQKDALVSKLTASAINLDDLYDAIKDCQRCGLSATRTNFVFGVGNESADLVLVGEAPGMEEDLQGEPFVGKAGQLLDKILASINFAREEVYIANVLKCRPPGNRDPSPQEVEKCLPYLYQQLKIIKPRLILAVGRIAAQTLLKTTEPLSKLRGKIHNFDGAKLLVTYHPAALLRFPQLKRSTWEDVQLLRKIYDQQVEQ